MDLIRHKYRYHDHKGFAQVYPKLKDSGYTRTDDSMCRQIRKMKLNKPGKQKSYPKSNYCKDPTTYLGDRVQIDVKYVPNEYIGFASYYSRYYQIIAIGEYSRKRYMELIEENSTYTILNFLKRLEANLGFKVELVQTDNGIESVNTPEQTSKKSRFEKHLEKMNIEHRSIRPYSPWQNEILERRQNNYPQFKNLWHF